MNDDEQKDDAERTGAAPPTLADELVRLGLFRRSEPTPEQLAECDRFNALTPAERLAEWEAEHGELN